MSFIRYAPIKTESEDSVVLSNAVHVMKTIDPDFQGPVMITKATLTQDGTQREIYLVLLAGIKCFVRNVNNGFSCLLAGLSLKSPYFFKVKKLMYKYIPEGSPVLFAGHSLGGMVAQQLASDRRIKNRYDVIGTVCFGSPLLFTGKKSGTFIRFVDSSDSIPRLSFRLRANMRMSIVVKDGGYGGKTVDAHVLSYRNEEIWGGYDCLGVYGGSAVISYLPADAYRLPYRKGSLLF